MTERDALNNLIDAWESLPGGRRYGPREIGDWLKENMSPAINEARKVLGRKIPTSAET